MKEALVEIALRESIECRTPASAFDRIQNAVQFAVRERIAVPAPSFREALDRFSDPASHQQVRPFHVEVRRRIQHVTKKYDHCGTTRWVRADAVDCCEQVRSRRAPRGFQCRMQS